MQKIINRVLFGQQMCLRYFMVNGITKHNSEDEIVQKYNRLLEIENDIILNQISEEKAVELYRLEVENICSQIQCRRFICKVDKVAYLGGMVILAGFRGEYYAKIDLGKINIRYLKNRIYLIKYILMNILYSLVKDMRQMYLLILSGIMVRM